MAKPGIVNGGFIPLQKSSLPVLPVEMWDKILSTKALHRLDHLKSLRLVNSTLNEVATRLILKDDMAMINLFYDYDLKVYRDEDEEKYFKDLLELLANSQRHHFNNNNYNNFQQLLLFPCSNFFIWDGFELMGAGMTIFFNEFGHLIKSLKIQLDSKCFLRKKFYTKILSQLSPTLESLTIFDNCDDEYRVLDPEDTNQNDDDEDEVKEEEDMVMLSSLKKFSFQIFPTPREMECVKWILTRSPNLHSIKCSQWEWPDVQFAEFMLSQKNLDKLSTFWCRPMAAMSQGQGHAETERMGPLNNLPTFQKIAESGWACQLKKIKFDLSNVAVSLDRGTLWPIASKIVNQLLQSSGDTIEEIHVDTPMGFLGDIQWPRLPRLRSMKISIPNLIRTNNNYQWFLEEDPQGHYLILNSNLNWTHSFPLLSIIHIRFDRDCRLMWSNYCQNFPINGSSAPSVKTLVIGGFVEAAKFPDSWFQTLNKFLPNLQRLDLGYEVIQEFCLFARKMWNLTSLKTISVTLYSYTTKMELHSNFYLLDPIFTGFDPATCLVLGNVKDQVKFVDDGVGLRTHPSILNMKELTHLNIDISGHCDSPSLPLMSHVSALYALNDMSQLKVNVKIFSSNFQETKEAWKLIAPYVNLQIKDDSCDR